MAELRLIPQLGLRQQLVVRPDLIQSLKLLMEPVLNLEQVLRQRLSDNPLLEEVEQSESNEDVATTSVEETDRKGEKNLDKIDWQEFLGEDHEYNFKSNYRDFSINTDSDYYESVSVAEKSLFDHLMEQLGYTKLTDEQKEIGSYIIGNIDESGFLRVSVEDMAVGH